MPLLMTLDPKLEDDKMDIFRKTTITSFILCQFSFLRYIQTSDLVHANKILLRSRKYIAQLILRIRTKMDVMLNLIYY